jgi:hypothetical protein
LVGHPKNATHPARSRNDVTHEDDLLIVERRRVSLERVRGASEARHLMVRAPLGSWRGLDRFAQLRSITVYDAGWLPPGEGVGPIGRCARLDALTVAMDDETPGVSDLGGLASLTFLSVDYSGATGVGLSQGWLQQLTMLEEIRIFIGVADPVEVPLGSLAALPALRSVSLSGLRPSEGFAVFVSGFPALEHLEVSARRAEEAQAIWASRPALTGEVFEYPEGVGPRRPVVVASEKGGFAVRVTLAGLVGTEDQDEATERVEARLARERLPWAEALELFPETDEVVAEAPRREDLEALLAWLEAQYGEVY